MWLEAEETQRASSRRWKWRGLELVRGAYKGSAGHRENLGFYLSKKGSLWRREEAWPDFNQTFPSSMLTMGCRGKCGVREANGEYCNRSGKCSQEFGSGWWREWAMAGSWCVLKTELMELIGSDIVIYSSKNIQSSSLVSSSWFLKPLEFPKW